MPYKFTGKTSAELQAELFKLLEKGGTAEEIKAIFKSHNDALQNIVSRDTSTEHYSNGNNPEPDVGYSATNIGGVNAVNNPYGYGAVNTIPYGYGYGTPSTPTQATLGKTMPAVTFNGSFTGKTKEELDAQLQLAVQNATPEEITKYNQQYRDAVKGLSTYTGKTEEELETQLLANLDTVTTPEEAKKFVTEYLTAFKDLEPFKSETKPEFTAEFETKLLEAVTAGASPAEISELLTKAKEAKKDIEFERDATAQEPSTTAQKADFLKGLQPEERNINDYLGHPWTKNYFEVVPEYNLDKPTLKDLAYYEKAFGLDTSVANLQKKFDNLTKQEYAQKNAEHRASEDQYYQNMAQQNAQYQSAIMQASSEALRAGASRGMQFANQFAAQNVLADQNSTGALDLATQRNKLKSQEAEAYAQNAINADNTMRNLKTNILGQAVTDHANDVQRYAADAQLAATDATLRINNYQYNLGKEYERMLNDGTLDNQQYLELMRTLGTMYGSDWNYRGNVYGDDTTFDIKAFDAYNAEQNAATTPQVTGGYSGSGYSGSGSSGSGSSGGGRGVYQWQQPSSGGSSNPNTTSTKSTKPTQTSYKYTPTSTKSSSSVGDNTPLTAVQYANNVEAIISEAVYSNASVRDIAATVANVRAENPEMFDAIYPGYKDMSAHEIAQHQVRGKNFAQKGGH